MKCFRASCFALLFSSTLAFSAEAPSTTKSADTQRLRELRLKSRTSALTTEEKAELDQAMAAREWANRPKLPPAVLPERNSKPLQQYFADNELGNDAADGLAANPGSGSGPVRTLRHAVSLLRPGDTLHLAANATPYRETLSLLDVSGNAEQPIVIDGHGAIISGSDPLRSNWVPAGAPGLYQCDQLLSELEEFGDEAKLGRVFFLFDGVQQRMGRTNKGKKAPFKEPAALQPGEWTYEAATKTFYVKVAGALADAKVEAPYRRNGVTIRGRSGVSYVTLRNLICTHVLNDGFNLHGVGQEIVFENIAAYENGDDGCSPHETIECRIDGYWASRNSAGIGLGNQSVTRISNARLEGNFAADFAVGHAPVAELRHAIIRTVEPGALPLKVINPQDTQLTFENVQVISGKGGFEIPARTQFTARRITALVPEWIIAGQATVSESVIVGKSWQHREGGLWKGERNIYGTALSLEGVQEPNPERREVTPDLLVKPGAPFPNAGADGSAMRIPPRPWGRLERR